MSTTCKFRRTKSGAWAVMGPTSIVRPGATVDVVLAKGGVKRVTIESVGKSFRADGAEQCCGYPVNDNRRQAGHSGTCDECGQRSSSLRACVDSSGLGGECCPRCAAQPAYTRSFA